MQIGKAIARFFGGLFLVNAVPHLTHGLSGHPFQSPFASPPEEGLSSPTVNVCWGLANVVVAYALIYKTGPFKLRQTSHAAAVFAGMLAGGLFSAHHSGLLYAES